MPFDDASFDMVVSDLAFGRREYRGRPVGEGSQVLGFKEKHPWQNQVR